jgi:hypothetical protein
MQFEKEVTPIDHLYTRFISQLDSLIPFLGLAHEEIFMTLQENYIGWFSDEQQPTLPDTFNRYSIQVSHAGFLLGYSYAEAFITDLIWEIFNARRDLLPQDKALKFSDLLPLEDYERVVMKMIDSTVGDMNSLEKKILCLEKLGLQVTQSEEILKGHIARNALVHNSGRVNRRQPAKSQWQVGDVIELTAGDVHEFGLATREYAKVICNKANSMCYRKQPPNNAVEAD